MAGKVEAAAETVAEAHARDLTVHVGGPGTRAAWFLETGVDSVDTSSCVRNGAWDALAELSRTCADDTRQLTLTDTLDDGEVTA